MAVPSTSRCMGRGWSDLPSELLECIADRLGLIELLCFRGVCKNWNAATSTASARVESQPWFLTYGGESTALFADSGRKYSISIPELEGATCLASNHGWLLLYRETSISFFCPFSRALIHLPAPPPPSLISNVHRAAAQFSSPPTSPDCAVCVIARAAGEHKWKLYHIRRGADTWTEDELVAGSPPGKFKYSGYCNKDETFYFVDERHTVVSAAEDGRRLGRWKLEFSKNAEEATLRLSSKRDVDGAKERLGLKEDNEFKSISVCGTLVPVDDNKKEKIMIPYQEIDGGDEESDSQIRRKGVWLHPRFHHRVDPTQTW